MYEELSREQVLEQVEFLSAQAELEKRAYEEAREQGQASSQAWGDQGEVEQGFEPWSGGMDGGLSPGAQQRQQGFGQLMQAQGGRQVQTYEGPKTTYTWPRDADAPEPENARPGLEDGEAPGE